MGRVFLGMIVLGRLLPVSVPCLELGGHLNVGVRSRGHRAAVPVNRSSVGAGRRHVEGISLLRSHRDSGATAERTGNCQGRRRHRSWEVAKLAVSNAPEPSGCRNTGRGSLRPCSAGRRLINTRALIIKWLIVLAGPIEAAIYGGCRRPPDSHGRGKTLGAGGEATWIQTEPVAIGS